MRNFTGLGGRKPHDGSALAIYLGLTIPVVILAISNFGEEKVLLILLPIIYGVFYIFLGQIHRYINNPGMFVLNVISAIRYLIIPSLILIYPNYTSGREMLLPGTLLMIFEAFCLGLFLVFITRKFYRGKRVQHDLKVKHNCNYFLKIIAIYSLVVISVNPSILLQYNFVFASATEVELISRSQLVKGINGVIVDWGKLLLPLLLATPLIRKYRMTNRVPYYYLTILVIMALNVMVFSGTSRNSVIMPAVGSIFFLTKAFPNKQKKIFILMSLVVAVTALQLTFLKTEYLGTRTQTSLGSVIDYLEIYFAGPKNMEVALATKDLYSHMFSVETLVNDLFGNFPGLSRFFNTGNRTTTFFNLTYYGGGMARDQIIPSMGQGLFYFGYLFSFIPQMLIVLGMAICDSIYRRQRDLSGMYFLSYFAVRFGFTYIQDISIILSFAYSMVIPMMIILSVNQMIDKRLNFRRTEVYDKNKVVVHNEQH